MAGKLTNLKLLNLKNSSTANTLIRSIQWLKRHIKYRMSPCHVLSPTRSTLAPTPCTFAQRLPQCSQKEGHTCILWLLTNAREAHETAFVSEPRACQQAARNNVFAECLTEAQLRAQLADARSSEGWGGSEKATLYLLPCLSLILVREDCLVGTCRGEMPSPRHNDPAPEWGGCHPTFLACGAHGASVVRGSWHGEPRRR